MSRSEAPAVWDIVVADKGAGPYGIAAGPDCPTVITPGPTGPCGSPGPKITESAALRSMAKWKPFACRRPIADPSVSPPVRTTRCGSRR